MSQHSTSDPKDAQTIKEENDLFGACTVGMLFCGLGMYTGSLWIVPALQSYSWPSVHGTIESSKVGYSHGGEVCKVWYHYTVERQYSGGTVWFGLPAKELASKFHAGEQVPVFYSPANPSNAVLIRGLPICTVFFELIAVFLFILCALPLMKMPEKVTGKLVLYVVSATILCIILFVLLDILTI